MSKKGLKIMTSMRFYKTLMDRVDKKLKMYNYAKNRNDLVDMLLQKWCNGEIKLTNRDRELKWD